ncbi:MAG: PEP-CTERM sorting domain-containing protein [Pyrinomonadaceae bacterium]|nr:PEP-CTERM sorting domain-containing protein [Phycisphaerales bacterium]
MRQLICVLAIVGSATALQAQVNGGFETGDLTGWTQGGNTGFTAVTSNNVHTGSFSFQMGPVGSPGTLEQTLTGFSPGDVASLNFWLAADSDGELFSATLDGVTVLSTSSGAGFGYTEFNFLVPITNSNPILHFDFQHSPAYWYLDDVSVALVPAPGAAALLGLGGLVATRRRRSN